jgi:hypothetical protein
MDPDEALKELRLMVRTALRCTDNDLPLPEEITWRMAEVFEGLDGWISKGGFLPKDWESKRTSPPKTS